MRLPNAAHTMRPWRIHELAPDFEVEDVWLLRTPGGPDDLPRLVSQIFSHDAFPGGGPLFVRFLWAARWKIGSLLRLDRSDAGVGFRVPSLRERLPQDLPPARSGPEFLPFHPLYQLQDEWAAELANRTVHSVIHLGWVPDESGSFHGQMAVLVKANGLLGAAYMKAIKPFRYLLVYPALLRSIERGWRAGTDGRQTARVKGEGLDEEGRLGRPARLQ